MFIFVTVGLTMNCGYRHCSTSQKSIIPHVISLGKDKNSKFTISFLLNGVTLVLSQNKKNHKLNHISWGLSTYISCHIAKHTHTIFLFFSIVYLCYGLNVSKFICWNLILNVIELEPLGGDLCHEDRISINMIGALIKELIWAFHPAGMQQEDTIYETEGELSPDMVRGLFLDLRLLSLRICEQEICIIYELPSLWYYCGGSLSKLR
jgi:hypothetical protein